MKIVHRIHPSYVVPWWLGMARYDYWRNESVCVPIPLNLPLRLWWWFYCWLRRPFRWMEKLRPLRTEAKAEKFANEALKRLRDAGWEPTPCIHCVGGGDGHLSLTVRRRKP